MRGNSAEARQICVHTLVPGALAECVILALRPQEIFPSEIDVRLLPAVPCPGDPFGSE
jgi:hypothetical protein